MIRTQRSRLQKFCISNQCRAYAFKISHRGVSPGFFNSPLYSLIPHPSLLLLLLLLPHHPCSSPLCPFSRPYHISPRSPYLPSLLSSTHSNLPFSSSNPYFFLLPPHTSPPLNQLTILVHLWT